MSAFKPPFFRSPYNYDTKAVSDEVALAHGPPGESMTIQSMSEDADINVLMKRYGITGHLPENPRVPTYGDFSGITDFAGAFEAVARAEEMFMEYPADVRAKFNNDPQELLVFCSNPANLEEMRRLGLAKQPVVPAAVAVPPLAPTAPAAPAPAKPV